MLDKLKELEALYEQHQLDVAAAKLRGDQVLLLHLALEKLMLTTEIIKIKEEENE